MSYSSHIPHDPAHHYAFFDEAAAICTDDDIIVEVGAFIGHGTCYMTEQLAAHNKRPKFYAIDPWDQKLEGVYGKTRTGNMPWGEPIATWANRVGGPTPLYDAFLFYLNGCPTKDRLFDHAQFPAVCAGEEFEDESLAYVLLNYSREQEEIDRETSNWWPKIRPGGALAVHNPLWAMKTLIMRKT